MGTARSDHSDRDKEARIARLRKRVDDYQWDGQRDKLTALLKGILDLLADEL